MVSGADDQPRGPGGCRLLCVSGIGAKGPACFLVEIGERVFLCDLGAGPDKGVLPPLEAIDRPVDALLLSHQHGDHLGALDLLQRLGNPPIYATAPVAESAGASPDCRPLPLRGTTTIGAVTVTTGRSGHAPGGVWLHLADGRQRVLYMGDHTSESLLYAQDRPPGADLLILDASYGIDDVPLATRIAGLKAVLADKPALLPAPAAGRGPELALGLTRAGLPMPALCAVTRRTMHRMAARSDILRPGIGEELARIAESAPEAGTSRCLTIASGATLEEGPAADLATRWLEEGLPIVFTGYVAAGTRARRLVETERALSVRWNVHARLSENRALVAQVSPKIVVPAFGDARWLGEWSAAFAPSAVSLEREIVLP